MQWHLDNCQVCFARCATVPCQLSEAHCTLCNGTLPIVRSALHVVQRHLANCQKRIARCAKAPCQLSEAHCTLCNGTLTIVRSTLQIANRCLHCAVNQEIKCGCNRESVELRSKIISLKLIWIPALRSGRVGLGFSRRRILTTLTAFLSRRLRRESQTETSFIKATIYY